MDLDGDNTNETYTLRVANNTTPAECNTQGFSQTACGFVIEFQDIIARRRMNPYDSNVTYTSADVGYGNIGGWEYSDIRAYINSGKYLEGTANEIDYSTTGVYDKLPVELKNNIIATSVVSGYGTNDSTNFTTTDKLYLLSTHEIWEDVDGNANIGMNYYDKSYDNTRQLDYYKNQGVTTSNYSATIKNRLDNGNAYYSWVRSARSNNDSNFFYVALDGVWWATTSESILGVSPAFRIAG